MVDNVSTQAVERQQHLPKNMTQFIVIDVKGKHVTPLQENFIKQEIVRKSNGAVSEESITFMR